MKKGNICECGEERKGKKRDKTRKEMRQGCRRGAQIEGRRGRPSVVVRESGRD